MEVCALESPPMAGRGDSAKAGSEAKFLSRALSRADFAGSYRKQSRCRGHVLVFQMVRCHIFKDSTLSAGKNPQIPEQNKKKIELNYIRDIDEKYSFSNYDVVEIEIKVPYFTVGHFKGYSSPSNPLICFMSQVT